MNTAFWLDVLKVELDAMGESDLIEPSDEVETGVQVVGLVPIELRKLHTRIEQMKAEMLRFAADLHVAKKDKERKLVAQKAFELKAKFDALKAVFWASIRDEYKLWDTCTVGIARGWNVIKTEGGPPLPDLIRMLLGGL